MFLLRARCCYEIMCLSQIYSGSARKGRESKTVRCMFYLLHPRLNNHQAILTSFNRNFKSRNDGNSLTMNFLASPTIVTAMAFSGKLSFNPTTDSITLPSGEEFKFTPPTGIDLPQSGFDQGRSEYYPAPTPEPQSGTQIVIKKDSQRLELLQPFNSHFDPNSNPRGMELPMLKVLMRVRGKCTTDHISAAV